MKRGQYGILGCYSKNSFGGKADTLNVLMKKGISIPRGFCVSSIIGDKDLHDLYSQHINSEYYITRSSADCEDGQKMSYAGLFESIYGYYSSCQLKNDIRKVFNSLKSEQIDLYEEHILGNKNSKKKMNVLIQEYISGDISGIYFSKIDEQRVINFIKGGNSLLVNNQVNSSKIYMDSNFCIIGQEYCIQEKYLNSHLHIEELYDKPTINKRLFLKLIKELMRLQNMFSFEIDVEWTIKNDIIYILQVRPITI